MIDPRNGQGQLFLEFLMGLLTDPAACQKRSGDPSATRIRMAANRAGAAFRAAPPTHSLPLRISAATSGEAALQIFTNSFLQLKMKHYDNRDCAQTFRSNAPESSFLIVRPSPAGCAGARPSGPASRAPRRWRGAGPDRWPGALSPDAQCAIAPPPRGCAVPPSERPASTRRAVPRLAPPRPSRALGRPWLRVPATMKPRARPPALRSGGQARGCAIVGRPRGWHRAGAASTPAAGPLARPGGAPAGFQVLTRRRPDAGRRASRARRCRRMRGAGAGLPLRGNPAPSARRPGDPAGPARGAALRSGLRPAPRPAPASAPAPGGGGPGRLPGGGRDGRAPPRGRCRRAAARPAGGGAVPLARPGAGARDMKRPPAVAPGENRAAGAQLRGRGPAPAHLRASAGPLRMRGADGAQPVARPISPRSGRDFRPL